MEGKTVEVFENNNWEATWVSKLQVGDIVRLRGEEISRKYQVVKPPYFKEDGWSVKVKSYYN